MFAKQSKLVPEFGVARKRILIINTRSKVYGNIAADSKTKQSRSEHTIESSMGDGRGGHDIRMRIASTPHDDSHDDDADKEMFDRQLYELDDLKNSSLPEFRICHLEQLSLSADQQSDTWSEIAHLIEDEYDKYTGFVVHHGKDTMVYAATAISFMLENLGKPVIFTGSVIPGNLVQSDLKRNIILSLLFAQNESLCDVCIVFAEKLLRANRTFKIASTQMQPFASPNMPPLALLRSNRVVMEHRLLLKAPRGRLRVHSDMSALVLTIKLVPGMRFDVAMQLVETTRARAIVICGFGSGNVPVRRGVLLSMVANAIARGVLVVVCTQNRFGIVDLGDYDTARQLMAVGAIGSADMTIEATIVKVKYLFGRGYDAPSVRSLLHKCFRGETSENIMSKI
jgi:L-asparaginase